MTEKQEGNTPIERPKDDMGITSEVLKLPEDEAKKAVVKSLLEGKDPYEIRLWRGKIKVYICNFDDCGVQMDSEDEIIVHSLYHFPEESREAVLDILLDRKIGD